MYETRVGGRSRRLILFVGWVWSMARSAVRLKGGGRRGRENEEEGAIEGVGLGLFTSVLRRVVSPPGALWP